MNPKVSVAGSVLVIIGGLLMLLVGAFVAYVIGGILSGFHVGGTSALTSILFLGPLFGLIVILMGVFALVSPNLNVAWGVIAIVVSILSIFSTAIGGIFLGFILALIGGILIAVKRAPPPPAPMTPYGTQPYGTQPYGTPPPPGAPP
jgi:Family of unknown function (DUF6114)